MSAPRGSIPRLVVSAILFVAWMGFIFAFSANNGDTSQGMSDGLIAQIAPYVISGFDQMSTSRQAAAMEAMSFPIRKSAHFCEYMVLAILTANLLWQGRNARGRGVVKVTALCLIAWVWSTLFACTDEFHQLFVDGRAGQLRDVFIDSAGAAVGVAICRLRLSRLVRKDSLRNNCKGH